MKESDSSKFNFFIDSVPFANSTAKILEAFIKNKKLDELRILELCSFPGIFTKNIFLSLKDLDLIKKIFYCIHESSSNDLEKLISKNSLASFGLRYELLNSDSIDFLETNTASILILNNLLNPDQKLDLKQILSSQKNQNLELILGSESKADNSDYLIEIPDFDLWQFDANYLRHYAYIKKGLNKDELVRSLEAEFKINNNYEKYFDLTRVLYSIKCPQTFKFSKNILDELIALDGYSPNCHLLIARYQELMGDKQSSGVSFKKAQLLDTYKLLNIH